MVNDCNTGFCKTGQCSRLTVSKPHMMSCFSCSFPLKIRIKALDKCVGLFLRNIWSDLCGLACGCVWGMIPVTVQHNTEGGRRWRSRWVLTGKRVDAGGEAESHTGSYPPRCFHLAATARLLLLRPALSSSSWRTCLRLIWRLSSRSWRLRRSWRKEGKKTVP